MRPFLTAEWRHLLIFNYAIDPDLLQPHLPDGVELDSWQGQTFISMVGFRFLNTKVRGWRVPFHVNFEEVNLRFYVRRRTPEGWRRGVIFIKEIVPRQLIATVARICYNEPYAAMAMRHTVEISQGSGLVEYAWHHQGRWNSLRAFTTGPAYTPAADSEEEFITEHYWGYTARPNGGCTEYYVEHEKWNKFWAVKDAALNCTTASLYGEKFVQPLSAPPSSAFVVEGSPVSVNPGAALGL